MSHQGREEMEERSRKEQGRSKEEERKEIGIKRKEQVWGRKEGCRRRQLTKKGG